MKRLVINRFLYTNTSIHVTCTFELFLILVNFGKEFLFEFWDEIGGEDNRQWKMTEAIDVQLSNLPKFIKVW